MLLSLATAAHAQQPAPAATPRPLWGFVRFWNMYSNKAVPALQLLSAEDKPLTTSAAYNYVSGYTTIEPGTYTFIIRRPGDTANPIKKQPVVLRADTYITFLVTEKNGQPAVELIDDTLDPKKAGGTSRLVIRQFFPQAKVGVATKEGAASQDVVYGETTTLENLPNRVVLLSMKAAVGPDVKTWNTEADFTAARHATLLVVPDSYGRFRPRLAYDGQTSSVPEPTPTPTPTP